MTNFETMGSSKTVRLAGLLSLCIASVGACSKDSETFPGSGDGDTTGDGDGDNTGDGDTTGDGDNTGDGDGDNIGDGDTPGDGDNTGDGDGDNTGDGDAGGAGTGGASGPTCDPSMFGGMGGEPADACPEACEALNCPDNSSCQIIDQMLGCACDEGREGPDCLPCEQIVLDDDFANGSLSSAEPGAINGGFDHEWSCFAPADEPGDTLARLQTTADQACSSGIRSRYSIDSTTISETITTRFEVAAAPLIDSRGVSLGYQQRAGYSLGGGSRPHIFVSLRDDGTGQIRVRMVVDSDAGAEEVLLDETGFLSAVGYLGGFDLEFDINPSGSWELRFYNIEASVVTRSGNLGTTHDWSALFNESTHGSAIRAAAYVTGDMNDSSSASLLIDRITMTTRECGLD